MNAYSPGLPKRNPGLKLANAFSVIHRTLSSHTVFVADASSPKQDRSTRRDPLGVLAAPSTTHRYHEVVLMTSSPRSNAPMECEPAIDDCKPKFRQTPKKQPRGQPYSSVIRGNCNGTQRAPPQLDRRKMTLRDRAGGLMKDKVVVRSRNVLKRNSMRFAAALLVALASFVVAPNAALDAAPQHRDQVPGFYRLKVGALEVTALFDGTGTFDPHWLNGTKATMDGVVKALHEDPHMLDVADTGFLVNTGKQLILVDAGAGAWWGG